MSTSREEDVVPRSRIRDISNLTLIPLPPLPLRFDDPNLTLIPLPPLPLRFDDPNLALIPLPPLPLRFDDPNLLYNLAGELPPAISASGSSSIAG